MYEQTQNMVDYHWNPDGRGIRHMGYGKICLIPWGEYRGCRRFRGVCDTTGCGKSRKSLYGGEPDENGGKRPGKYI